MLIFFPLSSHDVSTHPSLEGCCSVVSVVVSQSCCQGTPRAWRRAMRTSAPAPSYGMPWGRSPVPAVSTLPCAHAFARYAHLLTVTPHPSRGLSFWSSRSPSVGHVARAHRARGGVRRVPPPPHRRSASPGAGVGGEHGPVRPRQRPMCPSSSHDGATPLEEIHTPLEEIKLGINTTFAYQNTIPL